MGLANSRERYSRRFSPRSSIHGRGGMAWRDSRAQRQSRDSSLAIVAGVGALVAIHSLKASVAGIGSQGEGPARLRSQVSSRQPIPDAAKDAAQVKCGESPDQPRNWLRLHAVFPAATTGEARSGTRIEGEYPYYGKVETTPAGAWQRLQSESGVFARVFARSTTPAHRRHGEAR